MPRSERELSRSARLRKYGEVYKAYMRRNDTSKPRTPRRTRHNNRDKERIKSDETKLRKKSLNEYQKFVKRESKRDKYRDMRGSERMATIAVEWDRYKRRNSKLSRSKNRK